MLCKHTPFKCSVSWLHIPSLKLTANFHANSPKPKRKRWYSKHPFPSPLSYLIPESTCNGNNLSPLKKKTCSHWTAEGEGRVNLLQVFWGGSKLRPWKNTGNPSSNVLCQEVNTVDGSEIRASTKLVGSFVPLFTRFIHSRWCRISSINSSFCWCGNPPVKLVGFLRKSFNPSPQGPKLPRLEIKPEIFLLNKNGAHKRCPHTKQNMGYNFVKEKTQWKIVDALPKNYNSELNAGKPWCLFGRLLIFKFFRCVSGGELFVFVGERTAQRISPQRTLNWICFATQKKEIMRIDGPESQFFVGFRKTNYPEIIVFYHFLA